MRITYEIMTRPASKEYRDNYDRVFGKKKRTAKRRVVLCFQGEEIELKPCRSR